MANVLHLIASVVLDALRPHAPTTDSTVYAFQGGNRAGQEPLGSLLAASDGVLYGTTALGSNSTCLLSFGIGCGVAFRLAPTATGYGATILHGFRGPPNDGLHPQGPLAAGAAGTLFGASSEGGTNVCQEPGQIGCGTIFVLTPHGRRYDERVLYNLGANANDGAVPLGGVIADEAGALYATTEFGGGVGGLGAVVKLTPAGGSYTERVIFTFTGVSTGYYPLGGLIIDAQGGLYGTTFSGGADCGGFSAGCGAVFKLTPSPSGTYTETVIYGFLGDADGAYPEASLAMDRTGALYGTTAWGGGSSACQQTDFIGCGTVFKLTPTGSHYTERVLHAFSGGRDGSAPLAGVLVTRDGRVYGTTLLGGDALCATGLGTGCGTLFVLEPRRAGYAFRVVHAFQGGDDGAAPEAAPIAAGSTAFGTTAFGGGSSLCGGSGSEQYGCGTVFSLPL